jgi:hypothetical protein
MVSGTEVLVIARYASGMSGVMAPLNADRYLLCIHEVAELPVSLFSKLWTNSNGTVAKKTSQFEEMWLHCGKKMGRVDNASTFKFWKP